MEPILKGTKGWPMAERGWKGFSMKGMEPRLAIEVTGFKNMATEGAETWSDSLECGDWGRKL